MSVPQTRARSYPKMRGLITGIPKQPKLFVDKEQNLLSYLEQAARACALHFEEEGHSGVAGPDVGVTIVL